MARTGRRRAKALDKEKDNCLRAREVEAVSRGVLVAPAATPTAHLEAAAEVMVDLANHRRPLSLCARNVGVDIVLRIARSVTDKLQIKIDRL